MKFVKFILIACFLTIFSCGMLIDASPVLATSVISLSDEQLAANSDYILHATILKAEPFEYNDHIILTRVTVRVHEYLKTPDNDKPEVFEFYTRGGAIGDITQTVLGEFVPVSGAEVVVFLEKIRKYDGRPMVLGLTQGAFVVEHQPMTRSDRKPAHRILRNREFVRRECAFDAVSSVEELKALIRNQLNHKEQAHE